MGLRKDVRTLFEEALHLPLDRQESYLRTECAGNTELFEEVSGLLRAHNDAESLEAPSEVESVIESMTTPEALPAIGPYKLVRWSAPKNHQFTLFSLLGFRQFPPHPFSRTIFKSVAQRPFTN